MGTTYVVKIANSQLDWDALHALKDSVEQRLEEINAVMSTYLPDSDISRFNQFQETTPFAVPETLAEVTSAALDMAAESGGAFDPTVLSLVQLWGFSKDQPPNGETPSPEQREEVLERSGYQKLTVPSPTQIQKTHPGVEMDLNAIAKGYAVDQVATIIQSSGVENFFVEIGGECIAFGVGPEKRAWRIGIDVPRDQSLPGEALQAVVELSGRAIATSGDYRRFVVTPEGQKVSHLFDPRTHKPTQHTLASVTVVAESCMEADALATALYVMGAQEGMGWLSQRGGAEALFVSRAGDGFEQIKTAGFKTIELDDPDSTH
jgi:thiamine biosynthesis lipoprotein